MNRVFAAAALAVWNSLLEEVRSIEQSVLKLLYSFVFIMFILRLNDVLRRVQA